MNIVLASDNNFVQHCAVAMVSILKNNNNVVFYLLTEGLSQKNVEILNQLVSENNGELHILTVPSDIVSQFPMPTYMSGHISVATYYRLFVTELLPDDVDRVIYMDCDIVVRGSLEQLWNTEMDNCALGAVYQYNEWADSNDSWGRLSIPREYGYFNAGVLLMNLRYWRDNDVKQRLFDYIAHNYDKIHSHDQDTLNATLYKETCAIDINWNFLPSFFERNNNCTVPEKSAQYLVNLKNTRKNPTVVHYVYKPKPWESGCANPFRKEYYKYLEYTPWKGWRPKVNMRSIWENRIYAPGIAWISSTLRVLKLK